MGEQQRTNMLTLAKMLLLITLSSAFAALTSEIDTILPELSRGIGPLVDTVKSRSSSEPESTFVETMGSISYSSQACTAAKCCNTCELVPCGFCQEGCSSSPCTYKAAPDKQNKSSRNGCAKVGGKLNGGQFPLNHVTTCRTATKQDDTRRRAPVVPTGGCKCDPENDGTNSAGNTVWTRCASCDLVPWGSCQQGCKYLRSKDKSTSGATRNTCSQADGDPNTDPTVYNRGQFVC